MWRIALILALILIVAESLSAETASSSKTEARESLAEVAPAPVIRSAPGGGEMVILGPDGQYVIHGRRSDGDLDVGCTRHEAATHTEAEPK